MKRKPAGAAMKRVLIANRGEIALRVVRACRKLELSPLAVFSDADHDAPHVQLADAAAHLGPAAASESYLRIDKLLDAANSLKADAVHPGYGFLSESPEFAEAVESAGLIFVGPRSEVMRRAGHKDSARRVAASLGLKIPEGYDAPEQSEAALLEAAHRIGVPLLIKAAAGGGGRGMRLVTGMEGLSAALTSASREAKAFFGDGRLILERYLAPARHIEVQLIADTHGNICHLFERDCSLQRRYQKVIEIGPAPGLSQSLRDELFAAALKLGRELQLTGAATAEFLVPLTNGIPTGELFFLEINPRIQVEHPVTELITGQDLVELQLRVARGEKLPFLQDQLTCTGAAIEARVCAEVPAENFRPSGGVIQSSALPQESASVRIDHALADGLEVSGHYDSLLMKIICCGENHAAARNALLAALAQTSVAGVDTNQWFLANLLESRPALQFDAGFIDRELASLRTPSEHVLPRLRTAAAASHLASISAGGQFRYFRNLRTKAGANRILSATKELNVTCAAERAGLPTLLQPSAFENGRLELQASGETVVVERSAGTSFRVHLPGAELIAHLQTCLRDVHGEPRSTIRILGLPFSVSAPSFGRADSDSGKDAGTIQSPLPGRVLKVHVAIGAEVRTGDSLVTIESMKMEHALTAPLSGTISELRATEGESVRAADILLVIVPALAADATG